MIYIIFLFKFYTTAQLWGVSPGVLPGESIFMSDISQQTVLWKEPVCSVL